jgi:hypothetical protein
MSAESASSGLKRLGHETGYAPPPSTQVKNGEAILPLVQMFSWRDALKEYFLCALPTGSVT